MKLLVYSAMLVVIPLLVVGLISFQKYSEVLAPLLGATGANSLGAASERPKRAFTALDPAPLAGKALCSAPFGRYSGE